MAKPSSAAETAPAISEAQRIEIARGAEREKRFTFVRTLARFNGVGIGLFASISLLSAVFDVSSLLLAFPLAAIALVELNGGQRVGRYERAGLVQLACNQLALVALVAVYAISRVMVARQSASPIGELLTQGGVPAADLGMSGLDADMGDLDEMYRTAVTAFYGLVLVATALVQGGCALYYYSRLRLLDEFLSDTPRWVVTYLRSGGR